jgi:hypothetical protein
MGNNLTGDFDVVVEFALPAVDRVLAAMHQCERLLHSIAVRVDDNPLPGPRVPLPTAVGVVDAFGDASMNHRIRGGTVFPSTVPTNPVSAHLGGILNPGELVATEGTITPSNLQGIAQLQLASPTVSVPPQPNCLTVTTNVMVRYFPDKNTAAIAEFIRGDVQITAPMNKVASGRVHVLNIDFKAQDATIRFTPTYASKVLTPEDLAAINLCLLNGLRTSFLPSSVTLPSSVADVQLKTLPGAVAVLLNLNSHPAAVASVTNVFLSSQDDFAFAAGRDYIFNALRPIVDNILSQPPLAVTVTFGYHFSFFITLNTASFDLQPGKILLSIKAHAQPRNHTWVGGADFTIAVEFFLQPSGNTVQLGVNNVSISFDSSVTDAFASLIDYFTGDVSSSVRSAVMTALDSSNAFAIVDQMFNTDTNLANFLNAQFVPPDGSAPIQAQKVSLLYLAADIQPAGIVLRGLLLLVPWADANVQFEGVQPAGGVNLNTGNLAIQEQDYSALKSWIPGGRIDQYEWSYQGQTTPFRIDPNTFVLKITTGATETEAAVAHSVAVPGYTPLCLTVRGTRVRNYGPGSAPQPVVTKACGYRRFPVLLGGLLESAISVEPMLALTKPGADGHVLVTGHATAQTAQRASSVPNLLVHFADSKSIAQLGVLAEALHASKKANAPTAIIAVVPPGTLAKTRYTPGVVYAEDAATWQARLGLKAEKAPFTALITPEGKVVWQKDGALHRETLTSALNEHLVATSSVHVTAPKLKVRIGQPATNFLFGFASGPEMPLSKLRGNSVSIVFWKASCRPSIDAVRALQAASLKAGGSFVLAINDGDAPQLARTLAAENGFSEIFVADPDRTVSFGYGVDVWPTIVSVNASGVINAITYGFDPGEEMPPGKATASPANEKR